MQQNYCGWSWPYHEVKTMQRAVHFLFLLYHISVFFLLSSRRADWGRWSALRCSYVKLLLSAYRFFHVPFPSWEDKCSMLDNLLFSCVNIVSNTIDMLFQYTVYVLSLLVKASVTVIFSQHRRLTPETNIVSCSCMIAAVAFFIPDVCCFGAACSLA